MTTAVAEPDAAALVAAHPPMLLYQALCLMGGAWTSSGASRRLDPALILAEAWAPSRLQRCREHLAAGREAPAIHVVGYRLGRRTVLYGVSDGLHRTVAHREAGLAVKARIGGYYQVEPEAHALWRGSLWRREGRGLALVAELDDPVRPVLAALGVRSLPDPGGRLAEEVS